MPHRALTAGDIRALKQGVPKILAGQELVWGLGRER